MIQSGKEDIQHHILIVDDQPANLASLEQILGASYRVSKGENGQVCLDLAQELKPDLILLDVDMPLMDGLTVCRKLKSDPATSMIPIIFVSALSRLEERLAGYRAGGDDYVAKPYNIDELLAKIRIVLNMRFDLEAARERAQQNLGSVADSLSACNELDALKQFFHQAGDCRDLRSLGEKMLSTFDYFGLRVILRMLKTGHYFSHAGEVGALDQEMMEAMYDKGQLIDFGHRTLINAEHISVLVRNMPLHDVDRYRRWKESLTLLVGVANSCIEAVEDENVELHQAGLQSLVKGLSQLIEHLQDPELEVDQSHATSRLSHLVNVWESSIQAS